MKAQAQIPLLEYNGYAYNDIVLNGEFENKEYTGAIVSTDPNIAFDFDGNVLSSGSYAASQNAAQAETALRLAANGGDTVSINFEVKALTVNGVAPTEATVKDGTYLVQRPFVLVTKEGTALSETAQKFFDFAISADAASIISAAGAVPVA